ncbi:MAG: hypothetical protein M9887_10720, partial [Chitinophagales bacterium]|nr:hypothetical protein [Chitinophagales bacterium]
ASQSFYFKGIAEVFVFPLRLLGAYKVYKELERYLKNKKVDLSPEKVIEILQNIYQIEVCLPNTNELYTRVLLLTDEQKNIAKIFGF